MNKKTKEHAPLLPFVTVAQILDYDPERPETSTGSRIMDVVSAALKRLSFVRLQDLADYLQVSGASLSGAVEIATGLSYTQLRNQLRSETYNRLVAAGQAHNISKVARAMGYADASGAKRFLDFRKRILSGTSPEEHEAYKSEKRTKLPFRESNKHRNHEF